MPPGFYLPPFLPICDPGASQEPTQGIEPIITWKDFQKTMPWEIVILVGGGYALASGSKVTIQLFLVKYWSRSFLGVPYNPKGETRSDQGRA